MQGIEAQLEQELQLQRFFHRLLAESLQLGATAIHFRVVGEGLQAVLKKHHAELKTLNLSPDWLSPLGIWLLERSSILADFLEHGAKGVRFESINSGRKEDPAHIFSTHETLVFSAAVRVADKIVSCKVEKSLQLNRQVSLEISALRTHSLEAAMAIFEGGDRTDSLFRSIVAQVSGLVVVASPDASHVRHSVGAFLSLSNAYRIRDLPSVEDYVTALRQTQVPLLLVAPVCAQDPVDGLLKMREYGLNVKTPELLGVVCQGFVRRVCDRCARETKPDPRLLEDIPDIFKPQGEFAYLVGRGCDMCGHSGYRGLVSIRSILGMDDEVRRCLGDGDKQSGQILESEQTAIVNYAYSRGMRPLLEIGLPKVLKGETTLEALFELSKFIGPAFTKLYVERKNEPIVRQPASSRGKMQDPPSASAAPAQQAHRAHTRTSSDGYSLLLVEDDPDQQKILEMVFRGAGYKTHIVNDGLEALDYLKENRPDLIVTDLMMPRMDGKELVSRLKLQEKVRNIPILVLTVVADSEKEFDLLDMGVDDYCEKTIQRKVLLKRVENLLKR